MTACSATSPHLLVRQLEAGCELVQRYRGVVQPVRKEVCAQRLRLHPLPQHVQHLRNEGGSYCNPTVCMIALPEPISLLGQQRVHLHWNDRARLGFAFSSTEGSTGDESRATITHLILPGHEAPDGQRGQEVESSRPVARRQRLGGRHHVVPHILRRPCREIVRNHVNTVSWWSTASF